MFSQTLDSMRDATLSLATLILSCFQETLPKIDHIYSPTNIQEDGKERLERLRDGR